MDIRTKRAYEPAASSDGYRVLIDRLWPRGVSRERARLDEWDRELPPSAKLREWFAHEPSRFEEFRRRYIEELRGQRPRLTELRRGGASTQTCCLTRCWCTIWSTAASASTTTARMAAPT